MSNVIQLLGIVSWENSNNSNNNSNSSDTNSTKGTNRTTSINSIDSSNRNNSNPIILTSARMTFTSAGRGNEALP